jgi:hypothetical protein
MRKKAKLLGLWVACKTPSLSNTGCICLVAHRRYQAPKSATHRLGWHWISNAYAIRGHRRNYRQRAVSTCKISELASDRGAAISHRITKCAKPVTVSRKIAPFMRLCATGMRDCIGAWRVMGTPTVRPRELSLCTETVTVRWAAVGTLSPRTFDAARAFPAARGANVANAVKIRTNVAALAAPPYRWLPRAPPACNLHIGGRDLRFAKPTPGLASYAATPARQRQRY